MILKSLIFCLLWLVVSFGLFYAAVILYLSLNLFSWRPEWSPTVYVLMFVTLAFMIGCYILAKYTKGKIEIWFSLLAGLVMLFFGVGALYDFYSEALSTAVFGRSVLSPHWFRITCFLIYLKLTSKTVHVHHNSANLATRNP